MRPPRIDYPGARHHVMNRGARRQAMFTDDTTRSAFLELLGELPDRFGVRVHGYALMPNHFHVLIESVSGNLSRAMRHLCGEFSRRINTVGGWDGPLFRSRFRNRVVTDEAYWRHLLLYVHLNPVRAGLSDLEQAAWTSHRAYLDPQARPAWLETGDMLERFGGREAYAASLKAVCEGLEKPPAGFQPRKLWAPEPTGRVTPRMPVDRGDEAAQVLARASEVTGLAIPELLESHWGRNGSPAKWFTAWWMSRRAHVSHGRIAEVFGASHSVLSQRVARIEATWASDPQLRAWAEAMAKT